MMRARSHPLWLGVCLTWLGVATGWSCSVPVFRYALDHWPGDQYELELNAAALKSEPGSSFVRNLGGSLSLNLQLKMVPGNEPAPARLVFPRADFAMVWSGAFDVPAVANLTNSPARAQIVQHLLGGDSLVWVVVESGDRTADDAAAAQLDKRLRYLGQVAQLPPIDPNDPDSRLGPGPELRVGFSSVRLKAGEAREDLLRKMLAGPKGMKASGPWYAAVFGRGRVLGAWPAANFGNEQIDEVCLFVLGACSCQVKNLNPGWDLLLAVDWPSELERVGAEQAAKPATAKTVTGQRKDGPKPEVVTFRGGEKPVQMAVDGRAGDGRSVPLDPEGGASPVLPLIAGAMVCAGIWAWRSAQSTT